MKKYLSVVALVLLVPLFSHAQVNATPVVNSITGPSNLNVGELGTWDINATDPEGGVISYFINWGDGHFDGASSDMFRKGTSFFHTYESSGKYNIIFTIRDTAGLPTIKTISVQVNDVFHEAPRVNISSQNGGQVYKIGDEVLVTWLPSEGMEFSTAYWYKVSLVNPNLLDSPIEIAALPNRQNLNGSYLIPNYTYWTIPANTYTGQYGGNYKFAVNLCHSAFGTPCEESGTDYSQSAFTITAN